MRFRMAMQPSGSGTTHPTATSKHMTSLGSNTTYGPWVSPFDVTSVAMSSVYIFFRSFTYIVGVIFLKIFSMCVYAS